MKDSKSSIPVLPESEASQFAELACVPASSRERFCKMLALEIETAHFANENLMNAETGKMEIVRAPDFRPPQSCRGGTSRTNFSSGSNVGK